MKALLPFLAAAAALGGCSSSDSDGAPVQGDNPAASVGREVPADMVKQGGPPRNTLPPGQGRSGGGTGGSEGTATR